MRICVYCASSPRADGDYRAAASRLGQLLAEAGHTLVYGGGAVGSMGALADGVLSRGGEVIGIIPHFMVDLEWAHPGVTELVRVDSMRERKHLLLTGSDAMVALPGGPGTMEELFEAISLKRLALYFKPIILLDTRGYYAPLDGFMRSMIDERFINPEHGAMWQLVAEPEDVLPAIANAPPWSEEARAFAVSHD